MSGIIRPFGLAIMATAALSSSALAQTVEITFSDDAKRILSSQLEVAESALEGIVRTEVQRVYRLIDLQEFLRSSANAQALANKGLGADYASNPGFVLGVAVNLAATTANRDLSAVGELADLDTALDSGSGAQISIMAGYNLASLGAPALTIYVNGLAYPLGYGQLDGSFYNLGAHLQVQAVKSRGIGVAEWGGLTLTSGLEVSRMKLTLSDTLESDGALETPGGSVKLLSSATGSLELVQRALTIPVELTTNFTLLKIVTVYGGGGIDFLFGGASIAAEVDGTLKGDTLRGDPEFDVGTYRVAAAEEGKPTQVFARVLGGLQVNLAFLRLFGQVNVGVRDLAVSVAAGARLVF